MDCNFSIISPIKVIVQLETRIVCIYDEKDRFLYLTPERFHLNADTHTFHYFFICVFSYSYHKETQQLMYEIVAQEEFHFIGLVSLNLTLAFVFCSFTFSAVDRLFKTHLLFISPSLLQHNVTN